MNDWQPKVALTSLLIWLLAIVIEMLIGLDPSWGLLTVVVMMVVVSGVIIHSTWME